MVKQIPIGCERCYQNGYIIEKKGNFAMAKACECILKCRECNGTGSTISKNQNGYTHVAMCRVCGVVRRNIKLYNLAGIPAKYSNVREVNSFMPQSEPSKQKALRYAKEFVVLYPEKRGFLLMGPAGLGKTHLAIGTISELTLECGIKCLFKDFFYLLSELKQAYSLGNPENEVLLPLIETEVLVIDELGKAKSSDWELNILDQLISKRYNAEKITLITTNYVSKYPSTKQAGESHEILEERVGERIASRLYEMCEFIHLKGEDHRKLRKKV
jgi:DNA replication protein DnaC